MLRITSLESDPFFELSFVNVGRNRRTYTARLPFHRGVVEGLFRRPETALASAVAELMKAGPDLLIMHDGPDGAEGQRGRPLVRKAIEGCRRTLVVRGHAYWRQPLATLENGTQVLNVDSRVIVLTGPKGG